MFKYSCHCTFDLIAYCVGILVKQWWVIWNVLMHECIYPLSSQATISVSEIVFVLNDMGQSDSNLRWSLTSIATYVGQDEKVQVSV